MRRNCRLLSFHYRKCYSLKLTQLLRYPAFLKSHFEDFCCCCCCCCLFYLEINIHYAAHIVLVSKHEIYGVMIKLCLCHKPLSPCSNLYLSFLLFLFLFSGRPVEDSQKKNTKRQKNAVGLAKVILFQHIFVFVFALFFVGLGFFKFCFAFVCFVFFCS